MKLITSIVLTVSLLLFSSCNPEVDVPAYIYIDEVDFKVSNLSEQGTSSHKIANIWVSVNGKDIGTYSLPALVPVIASGKTDIMVEAGIKLNGLAEQRPKYPLYTSYIETLNLKEGLVDTILPVFNYVASANFELKEDFESAGLKFSSIDSSAPLDKTKEPSLVFHHSNEPNNFSGIIDLPYNDNTHFFEIRTTTPLVFNSLSATDCFVEMNYCFTENVEIGMYAHSSNSSTVTTRQYSICNIVGTPNNTEWGKIYVNLTDIMRQATVNMNMSSFDLYMKCGIANNKTARFLFDNIKVVHR